MPDSHEESNLDIFFRMVDSVEDDISEFLENESNESGSYEYLVICFSYLRLYCRQVGIEFSQIEDYFDAVRESNADGVLSASDVKVVSASDNEAEKISKMFEDIERSLEAFENRCKKTDESFDEWNCVFIMYSCLRKYCNETINNYKEIMCDVLKIQSNEER